MGIFGSDSKDITRRLDKVDERTANTLVVEAELTSQIKEIARSFKEYMDREEVTMKDYARREEQQSFETKKIMAEIKTDVSEIKQHQITQPKDVAILLLQQKDDIDKRSNEKFATKTQVTDLKKAGYAAILATGGCLVYLLNEVFELVKYTPMAQ